MSRDPDSWYEEEYYEEIGHQEDIANAIKSLSEGPIREFLGTYGDAIDQRLEDTLRRRGMRGRADFPGMPSWAR
jgi:hypothetical protein